MEETKSFAAQDTHEFLRGGGEMGERIRSFNWSKTSLGPVDQWPRSLRTCVQIMLTSRQPIWIGWGNDLIKLYNDPYKEIVKGKHPWALGKPASVVWNDIWPDIQPMLEKVMFEDEGTYVEAQLLIMERNGYPEETYYTFSYTPVAGDQGKTEGMICFNTDDTERIISERQLKTLTELGKSLTDPHTEEEVFTRTINNIKENQQDFPFAILYRNNGNFATLEQCTDFGDTFESVPKRIDFQSPDEISQQCKKAIAEQEHQLVESLIAKLGIMPKGVWTIAPDKAIILPIAQRAKKDAFGFFVVGLNPYRILDHKYLGFLSLISDQISTSLSNVHSIEEERQRLEALSEIDRAKTIFFSNISHEFRTPLTLLLGPIEDIIQDDTITALNKEKAEIALRNAQRVQKLVNLLLDFSRIEAGKMEGRFEAVDIVAITEDLASSFRAAIEKAGMTLSIIKEEIHDAVYVDVDMWEKIILNLLSNAFKYSQKGTIEVSIKRNKEHAEISVSDTGVGIPEDEVDKIFQRFHRVQNDQGRSQEGTGIGLAMVKELVKLHNGNISVKSKPGRGSRFTISLPVAKEPLNGKIYGTKRISEKVTESIYVREAAKWVMEDDAVEEISTESDGQRKGKKPLVLIADDNADMRIFMQRILARDYITVLAHDGEDAFTKAIQNSPEIIISDIMMPRLDGFGLLKKLKNNITTRHTPLIFLSARAGEEAKVEGITAGADDYLVKPFSSKELLARIANQITIAETRRHTELEFYNLFFQSPAHIHIIKGPEYVMEFFHPLAIPYFGRDLTGQKLREAAPYLEAQGYFRILDKVYKEGKTIKLDETKAVLIQPDGRELVCYFNITYLPYQDKVGNIVGILQFAYDITEQVLAKQKLAEGEERLRIATEIVELGTWEYDPNKNEIYCSDKSFELFGFARNKKIEMEDVISKIIDEDKENVLSALHAALDPEGDHRFFIEFTLQYGHDKKLRTLRNNARVFFDEKNSPYRFIGTVLDITEIRNAEKEIREREKRFRILANTIHHIVWIMNTRGELEYLSDQWEEFTASKPATGMAHFMDFIHPEDAPLVKEKWQQSMKNDQEWECEYRLKNIRTQTYRWFLGKTLPFRDEQGNITNWIGSASDIQTLKEQSSWLEQQIQDRTSALKELNLSLKISNEDLQQFAHVASHDLKEPIRKIKTYSHRLQDEFDALLPVQAKHFLEKINSASNRMSSMIEGVLSYSSYSALNQIFEPVDLNSVIKEIEVDLEVLIHEKNATIIFKSLMSVYGAPVLIHQLFYNLINNSLKFSKKDPAPIIEITTGLIDYNCKSFVKIELKDNGIGFQQEQAENIFTTFTRLNSKDKFEGTGLGLSLCKKIIQKHGGTIYAEGIPEISATFTMFLPSVDHE
jgi:PAS domain S-box-containing protein